MMYDADDYDSWKARHAAAKREARDTSQAQGDQQAQPKPPFTDDAMLTAKLWPCKSESAYEEPQAQPLTDEVALKRLDDFCNGRDYILHELYEAAHHLSRTIDALRLTLERLQAEHSQLKRVCEVRQGDD